MFMYNIMRDSDRLYKVKIDYRKSLGSWKLTPSLIQLMIFTCFLFLRLQEYAN